MPRGGFSFVASVDLNFQERGLAGDDHAAVHGQKCGGVRQWGCVDGGAGVKVRAAQVRFAHAVGEREEPHAVGAEGV